MLIYYRHYYVCGYLKLNHNFCILVLVYIFWERK